MVSDDPLHDSTEEESDPEPSKFTPKCDMICYPGYDPCYSRNMTCKRKEDAGQDEPNKESNNHWVSEVLYRSLDRLG